MKLQELYKEIARREAKKSQVSIGNIREVIKHLLDFAAENPHAFQLLLRNIQKRIK